MLCSCCVVAKVFVVFFSTMLLFARVFLYNSGCFHTMLRLILYNSSVFLLRLVITFSELRKNTDWSDINLEKTSD